VSDTKQATLRKLLNNPRILLCNRRRLLNGADFRISQKASRPVLGTPIFQYLAPLIKTVFLLQFRCPDNSQSECPAGLLA